MAREFHRHPIYQMGSKRVTVCFKGVLGRGFGEAQHRHYSFIGSEPDKSAER